MKNLVSFPVQGEIHACGTLNFLGSGGSPSTYTLMTLPACSVPVNVPKFCIDRPYVAGVVNLRTKDFGCTKLQILI